MNITVPHYLYRCYDAAGRLLYIGCTSDPKKRLRAHKKATNAAASMLLQQYMALFEVDADVYPNGPTAWRAEQAAIAAEQPLFNLNHRRIPGWRIKPDIERYIAGQPTTDWIGYLADLDLAYAPVGAA